MSRYRLVIAAAAAALAGSATLAGADTPADAPEPHLAEPAPESEPAPENDMPPENETAPVVDSESPPVHDSDTPPAPDKVARPTIERRASRFRRGKGWFLGGSLGIGSVTYSGSGISSDSETATFFDARLGGMITERVALSAEFWSDGHRNEFDDSIAVTQNCLGLAVTYWATPHMWLKAGLGTGRLTIYRNGTEQASHESVAYTAGAGYEIVSRNSLAVDLALRLLGSSFDSSVDNVSRSALSLHAGVTWR